MNFSNLDCSWWHREEKNKRDKITNIILNTLFVIAAFLAIITLIFNVVFFQSEVIGTSMQPSFNPNLAEGDNGKESIYKDIAVVNRYQKGTSGDVVLVSFPQDDNPLIGEGTIIKRLIATGGQKVRLYYDTSEIACYYEVDGKRLNENYLSEQAITSMDINYFSKFVNGVGATVKYGENGSKFAEFIVKSDEVFLLGDNRKVSTDSTSFGCVKASYIEGRVAFSYAYNQTIFDGIWNYLFG